MATRYLFKLHGRSKYVNKWTTEYCSATTFENIDGKHYSGIKVAVPDMGRDYFDRYAQMLGEMGFRFTYEAVDLIPGGDPDGEEEIGPGYVVEIPIDAKGETGNRPKAAIVLVHLLRYYYGFPHGYHDHILPALKAIDKHPLAAKMSHWEKITAAWLSGYHKACDKCMSQLTFLDMERFNQYVINYSGPDDSGNTYHFNPDGRASLQRRMHGSYYNRYGLYVRSGKLTERIDNPGTNAEVTRYLKNWIEATKGYRR